MNRNLSIFNIDFFYTLFNCRKQYFISVCAFHNIYIIRTGLHDIFHNAKIFTFISFNGKTNQKELVYATNLSNATAILRYNNIDETAVGHNLGKVVAERYYNISNDPNISDVTPEKKKSILNSVASDYDVFESTALLDNSGWKYMSETNALPGTLRIPDGIVIPNTDDVIGGTAQAITNYIFNKTMGYIDAGQPVDPIIFNVYNNMNSTPVVTPQERPDLGIMQYFNILQWMYSI